MCVYIKNETPTEFKHCQSEGAANYNPDKPEVSRLNSSSIAILNLVLNSDSFSRMPLRNGQSEILPLITCTGCKKNEMVLIQFS